jgi:predicted nucleotidyltransferase
MNTHQPGVAEHLEAVAKKAIIGNVDKGLVNVSLKTLMTRLAAEFDRFVVTRTVVFGSFARDTRLPTAMDPKADVDVLVIFRERGQQPAFYLDQIRKVLELHYPKVAITGDGKTLSLQSLQGRVDLVPGFDSINGAQIPAAGGAGWQVSDPDGAARALKEKDAASGGLLLPLVRLAKYWNALNEYPFAPYELEQRIVNHRFAFSAKNLKAYFFDFMRSLHAGVGVAPAKAERVRVLRRRLDEIDQLLLANKPREAVEKIEALLPYPEKLLG